MPAELELEEASATVVPDEAPPRKKKKGGAGRERNDLLDMLAVLSGGQLEMVTRAMWGEAAKALSDIRAVCPDVSPSMIRSAAEAYRREWPKVSLSPSALAKNWGKFAPGAKKETARPAVNVIAEPAGDWRAVAERLGLPVMPGEQWVLLERSWKVQILKAMNDKDQATRGA